MRKENLCRHLNLCFSHYRNTLNKVHRLQTYLKLQYQLNCLFLAHWNTVYCVLERLGSWSMVSAGVEDWQCREGKHEISKIFIPFHWNLHLVVLSFWNCPALFSSAVLTPLEFHLAVKKGSWAPMRLLKILILFRLSKDYRIKHTGASPEILIKLIRTVIPFRIPMWKWRSNNIHFHHVDLMSQWQIR